MVLKEGFRISRRKFAAAALLTSGTLAWFFLINVYLRDIFSMFSPDSFWVNIGQILFYASVVFSAIVGIVLGRRVNLRKLMLSWIIFGVLSTILMAISLGTEFSVFFSIFLGSSLGLGLPSSMAFLADSTAVEERARVAGATILATFVVAFLGIATVTISGSGLVIAILLFAIVRSTSFLALALDKCDREKGREEHRSPKPAYKEFFFYLFPWVMFTIAAGLANNLWPSTPEFNAANSIGTLLRYAFTIPIFGFVAGVIADRFGRKQAIIIGLILLGLSFALLGFSVQPASVIFYLTASGAAWGSFLAIYLVVPGDLSVSGSREKFYAFITIMPLIVIVSFNILPGNIPFLQTNPSSFSQIMTVLLFLSIIPVYRAKETLSESRVRARKMKEHLNRVEKLVKDAKKPE